MSNTSKLTEKPIASSLLDEDYFIIIQNGSIKRILKSDMEISDISIDTTLSVSGSAADSKVVGDKIDSLKTYIDDQILGGAS